MRLIRFLLFFLLANAGAARAQTAQPVSAINCNLKDTILVGGQPAICKPFTGIAIGHAASAAASDHIIASCAADKFVIGQSTTWALTCVQPNFTNLAGTIADGQLPSVITAGGPVGDATHAAQITFDAKGRLTAVTSVAITAGATSVSGTTNRVTASPTTGAVVVDISASYAGQTSLITLGTIGTGVWQGASIAVGFTDAKVVAVSCTTITCSGTNPASFSIPVGAIANDRLVNSSITINGTSVALGGTRTLSLASSDFANQGTTITVLHGNAAGNPSFGAVVSADLNITTTTCSNQFIRTINNTASGGCASIVAADLPASGVTAGIYGDASHVATYTLDVTGRVTSGISTLISITEQNINTASTIRVASLGLNVIAPATGQISALLSSNNVTAYQVRRSTDTSPGGKFLDFLNAASATVFSVSITGVVTSGTWNGATITADYGGTGQTTYTKGDLLVTPGSTTLNKLAIGTDGFVLTADSASTNGLKWASVVGTGTVTTTGSPASGNLTKFSGATSIVNGDLSGDCATSGTLAITCTKTNGTAFTTNATAAAGQQPATATNDNACAGCVGEVLTTTVLIAGKVTFTTNTIANVVTRTLTAGDWDVSGNICYVADAGTTSTLISAWLTTTSATAPTPPNSGAYFQETRVAAGLNGDCHTIGTLRISTATTPTIYLSSFNTFAVSGLYAFGYIEARRMR